jgi:hypothetical protein
MIAPEVLLESKTARDGQLTQVSHEAASDVLSKAKALVFALWQGTGAATTEQIAEYYETSLETVKTVLKRHRDELESDGSVVLRGKALNEARFIMNLAPNTDKITIWTPRAALRLGMLLRDSAVAKQVRNVLLDVAQTAEPRDTGYSEVQTDIAQMIELAKIQAQTINEQQKILTAALASLSKTKAKEKKQPKWTPRSTSHLMEFVREVGLEPQPDGQVYISDLWQQLRDWYIKIGVLKVEVVKGKEKLTWRDLPNKRDNPVKAVNQVYRGDLERRGCSYLTGIGHVQGSEVSEEETV